MIVEISMYIIVAILLGYVFGWLMSSMLLKDRYKNQLNEIREGLETASKEPELTEKMDEDDFSNRLLNKDKVITNLTQRLSFLEQEHIEIEQKHEKEIDAFMFERIEITQKYKDLLKKFTSLEEEKGMLNQTDSWFSKFFPSPSSKVY